MSSPPDETFRQQELLAELVASHVYIAGDVVQVGTDRWALHGSVPVDGEVLVAEFASAEDAHDALARLGPNLTTLGGGGPVP